MTLNDQLYLFELKPEISINQNAFVSATQWFPASTADPTVWPESERVLINGIDNPLYEKVLYLPTANTISAALPNTNFLNSGQISI